MIVLIGVAMDIVITGEQPSKSMTVTAQTVTTTLTQVSILRETVFSTVIVSESLTTSCRTTFNSVACFTLNGNRTEESSCRFLTNAGLMYIRISNDSDVPVSGARINLEYDESFCPGMIVGTSTRAALITNASGWAVSDWGMIGNYSLFVNDDYVHPVVAFVTDNMTTTVVIRIPSYSFSVQYTPG